MGSEVIVELDGDAFLVNGQMFRSLVGDYYSKKTSDEEIIILKRPRFLTLYDRVFAGAPVRNVLELGVFEGGSIIYLALAFPEFRFVGVDIRPEDVTVLRVIDRLGLSDRVKLYYRTSQDNRDELLKIIETEFGEKSLGIVIDDASHQYSLSRESVEILFPRLSTGGIYCLEDWAWSHLLSPNEIKQWADKPALTNLVFDMVILHGTHPEICSNILVAPQMVQFVRGGKRILEPFQIADFQMTRGKLLCPL